MARVGAFADMVVDLWGGRKVLRPYDWIVIICVLEIRAHYMPEACPYRWAEFLPGHFLLCLNLKYNFIFGKICTYYSENRINKWLFLRGKCIGDF